MATYYADEETLQSASASVTTTSPDPTSNSMRDESDALTTNSTLEAAHLIKTLDSAFANMNQNAVAAARDAEEARRNARTASELARLYQHPSSTQPTKSSIWPLFSHDTNGGHRYPSTPATSSFLGNNSMHTPFTPFSPAPASTTSDKARGQLSTAEDMLSLSLELERTKQAMADERTLHEETKSELESFQRRSRDFENQMEKMLEQQESERQKYDNHIEELETDLETSNRRAEAAEEDAQTALELAKTNAESREQVEEWLQQALDEIQTLRAHIQQLNPPPKSTPSESLNQLINSPRKDMTTTTASSLESIAEEESESSGAGSAIAARPARALVAAGRQMLQRSQAMVMVSSPDDADERRRMLKEHLQSLSANDKPISIDKVSLPAQNESTQQLHPLGASMEAMDICRRTTKILKESGKRLQLSGRWWTGLSYHGPDELHLDKMTRHYCHEIEVRGTHHVSAVLLWMSQRPHLTRAISFVAFCI